MENSNKNDINPNMQQGAVSGSINLSEGSKNSQDKIENKENWVNFVNKTLDLDFDESLSTEQHVRNAAKDESLGENVRNLSKLVVNELDRQQKLLFQ